MSATEYLQVDFGSTKLLTRIFLDQEGTVAVNQSARRVTKYRLQVLRHNGKFKDIFDDEVFDEAEK